MTTSTTLKPMVRPVRSFRFKGASITVDAMSNDFTPEVISTMRSLSVDARETTRRGMTYGFLQPHQTMFSAILRNMRDSARGLKYRVTVSLNGKAETFVVDQLSSGSYGFREYVVRYRRKLIQRLRDNVDRPIPLHPSTLRPGSAHYRYNGNITNSFNYYGNSRVGYVHAEPGSIATINEVRKSQRLFEAVRPMTEERHIGIEIECGIKCTQERLGVLLRPFAGYVMIKRDGSVNVSNRESVELNLCAPISRYREILRGVTDVLNSTEVSARVNKTCGLHVHLDVREWRNDFNALSDKYARLISVQGILYSMQPQSRQDNTYCQKSKSRSIVRGASRYQGINAQSIWKYSTIETRLHAGTTDYDKIANWCDLLVGVMYSTGAVPKRALTKIASIFKYFPVSQSLLAYINGRIRQFANGSEEVESSEAA